MRVLKGFSLIELMIVVAIMGMLATAAIPAYQNYTLRTKISEVISLASAAKLSLYDYYLSQGSMPLTANNESAELSAVANLELSRIVANNAAVYSELSGNTDISSLTVTISGAGSAVDNKIIIFTFDASQTSGLKFYCDATQAVSILNASVTNYVADDYLPSQCRS
ncbi:pilin [Reinekea thalattae]|uniref:Prepilin-type N-terminal cleavage/methylation domain-containing protein n=1 Tax=Reinekea thalattae TaxID=2593301 RepID=A0A5C8Z515_9GAMM|nr:pilin [Reinekea thalattae]TXR52010.1 prepilin-type N-terminal cleavage/methylation domain-containing protein [Reinekea thalattae]